MKILSALLLFFALPLGATAAVKGPPDGGSLKMPRAKRASLAGPALRESWDAATRGPHGLRSPWGGTNGSVPKTSGPAALDHILDQIDRASARIHSLTADVQSVKYTKIVDDSTRESGNLSYRETDSGPQLAMDITQPAPRLFVYRDDTGWIYQPQIHQVRKYDLRRNRAMVQEFLLLDFGGSTRNLRSSFAIVLVGSPSLGGQPTVELRLLPRPTSHLHGITSIELWYSPTTWVVVQQKVNQPSGDYQLLRYSNLRINPRISAERFSTSFPGATVVTPQSP